jgi:hypothetical protein
MNNKSRKQVAQEAIGLGTLAQLSRNSKINNLGWIGIYVGIITLIGELIKFPIKWFIVKPFIFCIKIMWKVSKYVFVYSTALFITLSQFTYKGIKELNIKHKEKNHL